MSGDGFAVEGLPGASRRTSSRARCGGDRAARVPHDGRCSYCGRAFGSVVLWRGRNRVLGLVFDHLVPVAAGGLNSADNSVPACTICNQVKGGFIPQSFADARLYVLKELDRLGVVLVKEATIKPSPEIECENCGTRFVSAYSRARFCSSKCRAAGWDKEHPRMHLANPWIHCGHCSRLFLQKRGDQRYCSPRCSDQGYNASHPVRRVAEQGSLFGASRPETPADLEHKRLSKQCEAILERLRRGPATNTELAGMALKYTSRISDLRERGHVIEVKSHDRATGVVVYRLREDPV
jgi:hypothetical protein